MAPLSPNFFEFSPSDYVLILNSEKRLSERRYRSNNEIIIQTNGYFDELDNSYSLDGIKNMEKRWTMCLVVEPRISRKLNRFFVDPPSHLFTTLLTLQQVIHWPHNHLQGVCETIFGHNFCLPKFNSWWQLARFILFEYNFKYLIWWES